MKHNLPMACLLGFIGLIGIIVIRLGIRQKRAGDVIIGALMATGSLLVYFLDFY